MSVPSIKIFVQNKPYLTVFLFYLGLFVLLLISYIAFTSGHTIYVDVTEGLLPQNAFSKYFYSFTDTWGFSIAEKQRIPLIMPLYLLFKLPLPFEWFIPIKVAYFYVLSAASFIYAAKLIIGKKASKIASKKLILALLLTTFFYLFNYWMTNRLMHFFMFGVSITLPLLFAFSYKYFLGKKPEIKYLVYLALVLAFLTGVPHVASYYGICLISIIVFAFVQKKYTHLAKFILITPLLTFFLGAFWLLPYLISTPVPDRAESFTIFQLLDKKANYLNSMSLTGYWWQFLPSYYLFENPLFKGIQQIIMLVPIAIFGLFAFVYKKKPVTYIVSITLCLAYFMSFINPISDLLYGPLFSINKLGVVSWLFREPEKIAYLTGFMLSLGILMALIKIKGRVLKGVYIMLGVLFILFCTYFFRYYKAVLYPNQVPDSYHQLDGYLQQDNSEEYNVLFYPQVQFMSWSKTIDSSNYFSNMSSPKPALPLAWDDSRTKYFVSYLLDENNLKQTNVEEGLNLLGVKYLIIRKDSLNYNTENLIDQLNEQPSLNQVLNTKELLVYENTDFTSLIQVNNTNLISNIGLETYKELSVLDIGLDKLSIWYTDLTYPKSLKDGDIYVLNEQGVKDHVLNKINGFKLFPADFLSITDPTQGWAKLSLTDLQHAESTFYFVNSGLSNHQFNFGEMVAFSLQDTLLNGTTKNQQIEISGWKSAPNTEINVTKRGFYSFYYSGNQSDTTEKWYELTSKNVPINGSKALYFSANSSIPYPLDAHVKLYFYDAKNTFMEEKTVHYSNSSLNSSIVVPGEADYFVIKIRTLIPKNDVNWNIEDFSISDISGKIEKPTVYFSSKNPCNTDCIAFARVLKSPKSKGVKIKMNGEVHNINTNYPVSYYTWEPLGEITAKDLNIEITNVLGINSVAAITVVSKSQYLEEVQNLKTEINDMKRINLDTGIYLFYKEGAINYLQAKYPNFTKENSTKYKLLDSNEQGYLVLKKPYSSLWEYESFKPNYGSGFVNAWDAGSLQKGSIVHSTQNAFLVGLVISFISSNLLGFYMLFNRSKTSS